MKLAATRTRLATLAAVALTVGAVAAPTASACPLDPSGHCLVVSPDSHKTPVKPAKKKAAKANGFRPYLAYRGG